MSSVQHITDFAVFSVIKWPSSACCWMLHCRKKHRSVFVFKSFVSFIFFTHLTRSALICTSHLNPNGACRCVLLLWLSATSKIKLRLSQKPWITGVIFQHCDGFRLKLTVAVFFFKLSACCAVWRQSDVWSSSSFLERAAPPHGRLRCPAQKRAVRGSDWPHPGPPLPAGWRSHLLLHGAGETKRLSGKDAFQVKALLKISVKQSVTANLPRVAQPEAVFVEVSLENNKK